MQEDFEKVNGVWKSTKEYHSKYRKKKPQIVVKCRLKYRYNITPERYEELFNQQGGVCFICKKPPKKRKLSVDHDHKCCPGRSCGKCVRALLCCSCNYTIGYIETHPEVLQYLSHL